MNALTLLKQDHGNVEELFHRFETAGPEDVEELARVRDLVIEHLSRHAAAEEQVFYPALRTRFSEDDTFAVLEALEEHHVAKATLSELETLAPGQERFRPKMTVLIESVRHHVEEEENELFPKVRDAFTVEELNALGEQLERAREMAPTRAHPFLPDTPPFNVLLGVPVAIIDGAIAAGKEAVGRLVINGRSSR